MSACGGFVLLSVEITGDGGGFLPGLSSIELVFLTVLVGGEHVLWPVLTDDEYVLKVYDGG